MKFTPEEVEAAGKQVTDAVHVYAPDGQYLAVAYRQMAIELACQRNALRDALKPLGVIAKDMDYDLTLQDGGKLGFFLTLPEIRAIVAALLKTEE